MLCVLDLRELPLPGLAAARSEDSGDRTPGRGRRVLVVEDSVGVRELERAVLTAAGYDVDTAVDGLDGAARLTGPPYDLVLTDIEMPGLDGIELTRRIRATAGWAGGAGRRDDVAGFGRGPARRPVGRRQCVPAQERVRPGRSRGHHPASRRPIGEP